MRLMSEKCILYISSTNYKLVSAGTEKFMGGLIDTFNDEGVHSVQIFPLVGFNNKLNRINPSAFYIGVNCDGKFIGAYSIEDILSAIEYIKNKYNYQCDRVIINQLHGWKLEKLSFALRKLNLPIIVVVHDYMMVCPFMMLSDSNALWCGNSIERPSEEHCEKCKYKQLAIEYFEEINGFFTSIRNIIIKVVFPSASAKNNWLRVFPYLIDNSVVRPHLNYNICSYRRKLKDKIRVGYLGFVSDIKGYSEWKNLMRCLGKSRFEFFYFGSAIEEAESDGAKGVVVDFNRPDSLGMVEQLKNNKIDIAFLWSNCQETYSYTYYEAFEAGCMIVTSDHSGNITDQVLKNKNGFCFDKVEECVAFLKELHGEIDALRIENVTTNRSTDDFNPVGLMGEHIGDRKGKRPHFLISLMYKFLRSTNR